MEQRLRQGEMDLEDFLEQLRQVRKMGPLNELLKMVPGAEKQIKGISGEETEKQLKRVEAMILSMTPEERRDPRILNGSRKRRIARGSGTTVQEINQLLNQYRQMQTLMKRVGKGKMRGLPRLFQ
jgi:signal recognition particle subunit SRP54